MFIVSNGIAQKASGDVEISSHMFPGINEFGFDEEKRIVFIPDEKQEKYDMPEHLFGDVLKRRDRIMKAHFLRKKMTAVLLSGNKGSGKTFLMKACINDAIERGMPVVNFNSVLGMSPDEQISLISKENGDMMLLLR